MLVCAPGDPLRAISGAACISHRHKPRLTAEPRDSILRTLVLGAAGFIGS